MKKYLTLLVFFISLLAISQDIKRENINGRIIVEGSDIEGIAIYNSSSKKGTVTDENGTFVIAVAVNDLIKIRGLAYQKIDVTINKEILKTKKLKIFLIEEINKLDEVIVNSNRLSGNIEADIKRLKTFNPKQNAIYFGIKNNNEYDLNDASITKVENTVLHSQSQTMVNGLNVVNVVDQLLIPLFRSEVKDKKASGVPEVPAQSIKYYLGSDFLVDNFNIPEHRVEEFIRYVEDKTFDFNLLNYGKELEFLELLNKKSKQFLNTKTKTVKTEAKTIKND